MSCTRVSIRVDLNAGVDENGYTVTTGDFDTGFMWEDANLTLEVPETTLATIFLNGTGPSAEFVGRWMAFDNIKLFAPGAQTAGSVKFGQDGTPGFGLRPLGFRRSRSLTCRERSRPCRAVSVT